MLSKFDPNSIQLSSIPDNAFNWLFEAFISNYDVSSFKAKIKALQHFIRAIDELHTNCENQNILLHWASIGSVFGTAASLSGLAILNPLIGGLVATSTTSSALLLIANAFARNNKIKAITTQLHRYKLAFKSSPVDDWAAIWHYLDDNEMFLDCLYDAQLGMVSNFKLVREDKKNSFAAALDCVCPQLGLCRDDLIEQLRQIKSGHQVEHKQRIIVPVQDSFRSDSESKQELNDDVFIVIKHLSDKVQNSFIVGLPGSGKDFLVSHATKRIKKINPDTCLFLIDCKNDEKEYGYYEHFDYKERIPNWECESCEYVAWLKEAYKKYETVARKCEREGHKCLVVINEGTRTGTAFTEEKDSFIKSKLTMLTSSGDSRGRNIWLMVQAPQLTDLGFSDNVRSQLLVVAILHESNVGAIGNWWRTNCLGKQLKQEQLLSLIAESPRQRIIYSGKTMQWYAMPELQNYSGYDRDKSQFLDGFKPKKAEIQDSNVTTKIQVKQARALTGEEIRLIQLLDKLPPGIDALISRFGVENNRDHQQLLINKVQEVAPIADRLDLLNKFGIDYE